MPYNVRKRKCKQSSGKSGSYVMSYTDRKGKKHSNCHTSKKNAQGQIAAIEGPRESIVRLTIREMLHELSETTYHTRSTFTRNPYEDPGTEFEPDEEDPVGLVRLQKNIDYKEEIKGRTNGRD